MEKILYDGKVKLKFSPGNHCYYANGKVTQGVTSALKELYSQDSLLEWYSSMASQDIVLAIAPTEWHEDLKKAFLEIYKGEQPNYDAFPYVPEPTDNLELNHPSNYVNLYEIGKNAPKKRSQYGKDVGTQVHEAIDAYHTWENRPALLSNFVSPSGDEEQDKVAIKSFEAYVNWFESSELEVAESELMVYSQELNYAGTLDRIYHRKSTGGLLIGDFKTSNLSRNCPTGVRESYWSQLGAYAKAYTEETGLQFEDAVIVNSPKNGSIKIVYASDASLNVSDLVSIWEDDIKAFRNHKFLSKCKLRSRIDG